MTYTGQQTDREAARISALRRFLTDIREAWRHPSISTDLPRLRGYPYSRD